MAGFSRTVTLPVLLLVFFFISFSEGRDYLIGGKPNAWTIPTSESDSLNHWAQKSRFLIGDSLGTFIHSFFNHIKVSPFSSSSTSKAQSHLFFFSDCCSVAIWCLHRLSAASHQERLRHLQHLQSHRNLHRRQHQGGARQVRSPLLHQWRPRPLRKGPEVDRRRYFREAQPLQGSFSGPFPGRDWGSGRRAGPRQRRHQFDWRVLGFVTGSSGAWL